MSSETSGAPAGPGTDRVVTAYAPPRRRSSSVTSGNTPVRACRRAGIISSVTSPKSIGGIAARNCASSASNGTGGPIGTSLAPASASDVVVITRLTFRVSTVNPAAPILLWDSSLRPAPNGKDHAFFAQRSPAACPASLPRLRVSLIVWVGNLDHVQRLVQAGRSSAPLPCVQRQDRADSRVRHRRDV